MPVVARDTVLQVDFSWTVPVPPLLALRHKLRTVLVNDSELTGLLGGRRVFFRPRAEEIELPAVTYFDFGTRPDATVPFLDRTYQLDVWERRLDVAERIAQRIKVLLHNKPFARLPGGEAKVVYLQLVADRDDIAEEGDIVRKTLEFRLLAYDLVKPH